MVGGRQGLARSPRRGVEGEMPEVRYRHVHLRISPAVVSMFALDPFVSARVSAIVGDEAHHRMDVLDRDAVAALRRVWPKDPT